MSDQDNFDYIQRLNDLMDIVEEADGVELSLDTIPPARFAAWFKGFSGTHWSMSDNRLDRLHSVEPEILVTVFEYLYGYRYDGRHMSFMANSNEHHNSFEELKCKIVRILQRPILFSDFARYFGYRPAYNQRIHMGRPEMLLANAACYEDSMQARETLAILAHESIQDYATSLLPHRNAVAVMCFALETDDVKTMFRYDMTDIILSTLNTACKRSNIFELRIIEGQKELKKILTARRYNMIMLKSLFFQWMLLGKFVGAESNFVRNVISEIGFYFNLYQNLKGFIIDNGSQINKVCYNMTCDFVRLVDTVLAALPVTVWILLMVFLFFYIRRTNSKRVTQVEMPAQPVMEVPTVEVNQATPSQIMIQDEMAMVGSTLRPTNHKDYLVVVCLFNEGVATVAGIAFRYCDFLVTARHTISRLDELVGIPYLIPFKPTPNGATLNESRALEVKTMIMDNNLNPHLAIDMYAIKLANSEWTKLAVKSCNVKARSAFGLCVSVYTVENAKLNASNGKILPNKENLELWHTATTMFGTSGSPLSCGTSVIGMHVQGNAHHNIAIRMETIVNCLKTVTESSVYTTPSSVDIQDNWEKYEDQSGEARMDTHGHTHYLVERAMREETDFAAVDFDDEEQTPQFHDKPSFVEYMNSKTDQWETSLPTPELEKINFGEFTVSNCRSLKEYTGYKIVGKVQKTHIREVPSASKLGQALFDEFKDKLNELGYDEAIYGMPKINYESEKKSLLKHLDLFSERAKTCIKPPTPVEMKRVVFIMEYLLQENKYYAPVNYKSRDYIRDIINSNLVNLSKSAGYPYSDQGLNVNKDVIDHYGVEGLIDIVLREWEDDYVYKIFVKAEPHKKKKLIAEMLRIICCKPTHAMIKDQALFSKLNNQAVRCWKKSPIVYPYSPLVPNDIEHIYNRLKGSPVLESDKELWDFNVFGWMYVILTAVIKSLAMKPIGMSQEDFDMYLEDVEKSIIKNYRDCTYRCSDGTLVQQVLEGIMKSGWVLTIFGNSTLQVVCHVLALVRLGITPDIIIATYTLMAGGDDILQKWPTSLSPVAYFDEFRKFGINVKEFEMHDSVDHATFFSNEMYYDKDDGLIKFRPLRLTKHIYKLRSMEAKYLGQALCSHMTNYCFTPKHFQIFRAMYIWLQENAPESVEGTVLLSRFALCYRVKGYESGL